MNRIFLFLLIVCFFISNPSNAQNSDTTKIVTDSGIVNIIKRTPVRLKQTIEIISERLKGHYYLSVSLGILGSKPFYSVNDPAYTNYVKLLYQNTKEKPGFIQSIELIRSPRQFVWTMFFDWNHIIDQYTYYYGLYRGEKNNLEYNYFRYGLRAGYWIKKGNRHSFIPSAGFSADYLSNNTGAVVSKELFLSQVTPNPSGAITPSTSYIKNEFQTRQIYPSLHLNLKYLLRIRNKFYIDITPYTSINLMNRMKSSEVFSEYRWTYGLKIGITQNIF
ncbi:MAG TPA: hypothetical protein VNW06_06460 [Cytophagaceae bacterium]|jgi:hypothetical protein|nr:hypothetical protein [Cytophagaceae bacterium]